jgi:hypothetical protein
MAVYCPYFLLKWVYNGSSKTIQLNVTNSTCKGVFLFYEVKGMDKDINIEDQEDLEFKEFEIMMQERSEIDVTKCQLR